MNTLKAIWVAIKEFTIAFWKQAMLIYAIYVAVISAIIGVWGFIGSISKKKGE